MSLPCHISHPLDFVAPRTLPRIRNLIRACYQVYTSGNLFLSAKRFSRRVRLLHRDQPDFYCYQRVESAPHELLSTKSGTRLAKPIECVRWVTVEVSIIAIVNLQWVDTYENDIIVLVRVNVAIRLHGAKKPFELHSKNLRLISNYLQVRASRLFRNSDAWL
jgi:hypothetical protein